MIFWIQTNYTGEPKLLSAKPDVFERKMFWPNVKQIEIDPYLDQIRQIPALEQSLEVTNKEYAKSEGKIFTIGEIHREIPSPNY